MSAFFVLISVIESTASQMNLIRLKRRWYAVTALAVYVLRHDLNTEERNLIISFKKVLSMLLSIPTKAITNVIVVCFLNITHTQKTGQNRVMHDFNWKHIYLVTTQAAL